MVTCENIEGYIYLEKWEDAYESSMTVLKNWDTNSEMMSLYYNSAELDSLNNEIVRLTQFTKSKSKNDSLASIHLVKYLIKQMKGIQELKINLRGIRQQYKTKGLHSPIEFVDGRIKTISSIVDKLERMGLSIDEIDKVYDIAGIRINCQFVEDIYMVVELLKKRQDLEIVETRDYISHQRASGYRSYHIHAYYHLETIDGMKKVMIEFQIRTLAMNFWASIEHSLNYKYYIGFPKTIFNILVI